MEYLRKDEKICHCGCIYLVTEDIQCPNCNKQSLPDRIKELEAKLAKALLALAECQEEIEVFLSKPNLTEYKNG